VTRVSPVFLRHAHHAARSGYPLFVERLPGLVDVRRPRHLPRWLVARYSERVIYDWYGPDQLRVDLTATRRLVMGRHEVVHLLYGETDHFYAGRYRDRGHRRGNRLVATFHQPPSLQEQLLPAPPLFEQLDHAIALGSRAGAYLGELLGPENVSLAFLAVDTSAWHPVPERRADGPTCAFVGSWFRDFDLLADVIRIVHDAEPRVRFEAITEPARLDALTALPGVRARAGVSDAELADVYRRAWVHVLPLTDAVANNALLEGMASGVATVVSHVGDVEYYTGADAARLLPVGDAEAMANAVLELLGDRAAREELGARARARAEARDLDAAARRHAEIYCRVASG
jgi:glycosyltransferase involved in cell wall biosynthesis